MKSILRLCAAVVLAAGIFVAKEQPTQAAEACWFYQWACYFSGGYFQATGADLQCWEGTLHVQVMCLNGGYNGAYWCSTGSSCTVCGEGPCNG